MTGTDLPEFDCLEFLTTNYYQINLTKGHTLPDGKKPVIYGVSFRNVSDEPVRIIGRKWVSVSADAEVEVTEGDNLFGTRPLLLPGQIFAFNGFHAVHPPAKISLTLIGRDNAGHVFRTPSYRLKK